MTVRSSRVYSADDIHPPGGEGPWRRHAVQFLRGHPNKVAMHLAVMASAHESAAVSFHSEPVVSLQHYLLG
jgi:hypothetical protein